MAVPHATEQAPEPEPNDPVPYDRPDDRWALLIRATQGAVERHEQRVERDGEHLESTESEFHQNNLECTTMNLKHFQIRTLKIVNYSVRYTGTAKFEQPTL